VFPRGDRHPHRRPLSFPENTRFHLGTVLNLLCPSISFPHLIFFSSVPLIPSSFILTSRVLIWLSPITLVFDIPLRQYRPHQHRMTTVTFPRPPIAASTLLRGQLDRHSLNYRLILLHTHHKPKLPHLPFARPRTNTHITFIPSLLEKNPRGPSSSTTSSGRMLVPASLRLAQNSP
jgi:hypothetical protein